jgi:hypothetical protein
MKKLVLLAVSLLCFAGIASAGNMLYAKGDFKVFVPVRDSMNVVSLYDMVKGNGYVGLESTVVLYKNMSLNYGVMAKEASGLESKKTSDYISFDVSFASTSPDIANTKLGLWFAKDEDPSSAETKIFKGFIAGIKATTPLW